MAHSTLGLHWFRHDLRLTDNAAVLALSKQCRSILGVYVYNPKWDAVNQWGMSSLGMHRRRFIYEALQDLRASLQTLGSDLIIVKDESVDALLHLAKQTGATHISYEMHAGFDESAQIELLKSKLKEELKDSIAADSSNTQSSSTQSSNSDSSSSHSSKSVQLIEGNSNYLYTEEQLPFALENMPDTFSPFRRKVEKYAKPALSSSAVLTLETPINSSFVDKLFDEKSPIGLNKYDASALLEPLEHDNASSLCDKYQYPAGETGGLARIEEYFFATDGIASYKDTRNGLNGWDFSSRLSAYLAHGCLSPRTVLSRLKEYESERVANDSTYWLFFELLWREFFHLQHIKHGATFFAFGGIQASAPSTTFDEQLFNTWCQGNTGYKIVDACMRQLNATGFMSNRGRQLVASCFVHELNLDWRYGAAYFEQQLIDFDVASNWGNWQYLAGVGSDPRGHRQFNLAKQTEIYDPQGSFISKWYCK